MSKVTNVLFGKPAQATQSSAQGVAALPASIQQSSEQAIKNLGLINPNVYKPTNINQYEQQAFDARAQPVQTFDQLNLGGRIGEFLNPFRDALTADYQKLLGQQQGRLAADASRYGLGGSAYQALGEGQLSEGTMRSLGTTLANLYNPAVNAALGTVNRDDQAVGYTNQANTAQNQYQNQLIAAQNQNENQLRQQRISDLLASGAQVRGVAEGQQLAPVTKERAVLQGIASLPATSTSNATSVGASEGITSGLSKAGGAVLASLTGGTNPYAGDNMAGATPLTPPNFLQNQAQLADPYARYGGSSGNGLSGGGFQNPFAGFGTGQTISAQPTNYGNQADFGNYFAGGGAYGGQYNIASPTNVTAYQAKPFSAPSLGSSLLSFFGA